MNRITYSLNYRKPKDQYTNDDQLTVCLRYFLKESNSDKGKIIKKSTGIKCKLSDWNVDWHKSNERSPIKSSDKSFLKKNRLLKTKVKNFKTFLRNLDTDLKEKKAVLNSKIPS